MKKIVLFVMAVALGLSTFAQERQKFVYAKSILGQKAPELVVEEWISEKPDTKGKFVLIDFWSTTCGPCRTLIPKMNEWSKKYKDDVVMIALSYETAEKVKSMKSPVIEYYNGVDTKRTIYDGIELKVRPYVLIINPDGVVCWEGTPSNNGLTEEMLVDIIKKYKEANPKSDAGKAQTKTMTFRVESAEDLQKVLQSVVGAGGKVQVNPQQAQENTTGNEPKKDKRTPAWGKSVINQKAPELIADKWITDKPDTKGKFVMYHFWSTTCAPCLKSIPKLNEWSKTFKDDLVVIGVARDDSEERMKGKPEIEYYRAVDLKQQTAKQLDLHLLSYILLIDPQGIVRLEDLSRNVTPEIIREIIEKYK